MFLHNVSPPDSGTQKNKTIMQKSNNNNNILEAMHEACKLVALSHTYIYEKHLSRYEKKKTSCLPASSVVSLASY